MKISTNISFVKSLLLITCVYDQYSLDRWYIKGKVRLRNIIL